MGIDYTYESGENQTNIYVDGNLFVAPKVTFNYDFSQRHILIVSDNCTVNGEIKMRLCQCGAGKGLWRHYVQQYFGIMSAVPLFKEVGSQLRPQIYQ